MRKLSIIFYTVSPAEKHRIALVHMQWSKIIFHRYECDF